MSPKNVTFAEAIPLFFKNYVNFNGRSTRSEFWYAFLAYFIGNIVFNIISTAVGVPINLVYSLALFLPLLSAEIRRMHDIGKSGWYVLIPLYNIYLLAQPSDPNTNQYGDPAV